MSRMIDRLADGEWAITDTEISALARRIGRRIQEEASKYPIFVADDAVLYAYDRGIMEGGINHASDFHNIAPPFPQFWMEAVHANMSVTLLRGDEPVKIQNMPYSIGCHFYGGTPEEILSRVDRHCEDEHLRILQRDYPDAKWYLEGLPIVGWAKNRFVFHTHFGIALDSRGMPISDIIPGINLPDRNAVWGLRQILSPLFFALCFIHCKNIELIPHIPTPDEQRRRRKDKKPPLLKYHTLSIGGVRRLLDAHGAKEQGIGRAIHTCQGHFKTFTPERPLLGKHVGQYWWGDQVRGAGEHGIVVKDYRAKHVTELAKSVPATPAPAKIKPNPRHFLQAATLAGLANVKIDRKME